MFLRPLNVELAFLIGLCYLCYRPQISWPHDGELVLIYEGAQLGQQAAAIKMLHYKGLSRILIR